MTPKNIRELIEEPVHDLLCQALETEIGGVAVYRMAILCADHEELRQEWQKYLGQTERHVEIVRRLFESLGLDPEATTPGRTIVRDKGQALVSAMRKALKDAPNAASVVAAECVVDAETKDHQNWRLIGEVAKQLGGPIGDLLAQAYGEVEEEEDEHLYHSRGWCRELSLAYLGLPTQMPPLEEERDVKTALEAARADQDRKTPARARRPSRKVSAGAEKRG